jgi:hypothetical protein
MKKLSYWASHHKWPARIILIVSLQLLNLTGVITGVLLKDLGILLPAFSFLIITIVFFAGLFFYPKKQEKHCYAPGLFYRRQKICDGLLAVSAFCMFLCISNDRTPFKTYFAQYNAAAASVPSSFKDSSYNAFRIMVSFAKSMKDENGNMLKWKERKKLLKEQVRQIKQSTELSSGAKTGLIILCVLVAIGLILLALSLACNLSCNGHDGASVLVGVGGTALVIFLFILAIRAIYPGKRKKRLEAIRKEENKKTD